LFDDVPGSVTVTVHSKWLFVGVAPPSFIAIQAGTTLQQLTSSGDALSWQSICILAVLAIIALLPVVFRAKLRQKFD